MGRERHVPPCPFLAGSEIFLRPQGCISTSAVVALCLEVAFRLRAVLCRCTSKDIAFSCGDLSSLFFHLLFPCSTHFRGTLLRESERVSGVYAPTQSTQTCSAHCITSVFD